MTAPDAPLLMVGRRADDLRCYGVGGCDVPDAQGRPTTDRQAPPLVSRHARVHRPAKGSWRLRRMGLQVRKLANSSFSLRVRLAFSATPERDKERERKGGERDRENERERNLPALACVPAWPLPRGRLESSTSTTPSLANPGQTKLGCTY